MGGELLRVTCFDILSHLLFTPRPCTGGAGVGSVFLIPIYFFYLYLFPFLKLPFLPLIPKPHPYPLSKGRGGLCVRGIVACDLFRHTIL